MAPRIGTLDSRVARVEEAILGFKEDRIEAREDRKDIIARLDRMSQNVQSTGQAVANLALEKCGERLSVHDSQLSVLSNKIGELEVNTQNFPVVESEVMFWRRVLGGGFHAFWKISALVIGSGGVGGVLVKVIWPH